MGKMALWQPLTDATFTYAYRNTAGSWSSETSLTKGVHHREKNFIAPACDELRITGTLSAAATLKRVHLAGLNVLSGLEFEVIGDAQIAAGITQAVYAYPERYVHRQTLQLDNSTASTNMQLIITGIAQAQLNIRHLMFATDGWVPTENFDWQQRIQLGPRVSVQSSEFSRYGRLNSTFEGIGLQFSNTDDIDYLALRDFLKNRVTDGFCLFEKDVEDTDHLVNYAALALMPEEISGQNLDANNFQLPILEAFAQ